MKRCRSPFKATLALILLAATPAFSQPKPKFNNPGALANAQVGVDYSVTLTVSGGQQPYAWLLASGSLPNGLSLSPLSGLISGRPTAVGNSSFRVTVTDLLLQTDAQNFTINTLAAPPPPSISTASLPGGVTGTAYSQTLSATSGTTPYSWSITTGTLPSGLTLSSAGAISGTPTTAGAFDFTVKVTDSANLSASKSLRITIVAPLVINTSTLPAGVIGTSYTQTLSAGGGTTPYSWSVLSGALPSGLALSTAGVISGTPTTAASFTFTAKVTDTSNVTISKSLTIAIAAMLSISTLALPGGTVGINYAQTLTPGGGTPPYTWSISVGALPPGLTMSSAGAISGSPTTAGSSDFTAMVIDSTGLSDSKPLRITIGNPPSISSATLPGGTVGTAYAQNLTVSGGTTPYSWAVSGGNLPSGLTMSAGGSISGTPTVEGSFDFTAKVTDSANLSDSKLLRITVVTPPSISTASLPAGTVSISYTQALSASGGTPPYTWSIAAGTLPPGLTISAAGSISGTPTTAGSFDFTAKVMDTANLPATKALRITIILPPTISTASLPAGTVGIGYTQTLSAGGGTTPFTWSIAAGSLPPGLVLSTAGGISGTPTAAGAFDFTAKLTDSASLSDSKALRITIAAQPSISTGTLPSGTVGVGYLQTLSGAGGTSPYAWAINAGSLPPGLALSAAGVISGTPATAGDFSFTLKMTDAGNLSASRSLILSIGTAPIPLSISTASLPAGTTGTAYSQTLSASGGTAPYIWDFVSGGLPPGLNLSGSGAITGTPTTAGQFDFTARVTDSVNLSDFKAFRITINASATPPVLTTASLPAATAGTSYSQPLTATGGTPPYSWSIDSGTLPAGVNLTTTGTLAGVPTTAGSYDFTAKVTDSSNLSSSKSLRLTVNAALPALTITTASLPGGVARIAYSSTVTASGGQSPYTWSVSSGGLPPGLALQASSGLVSGTPTASGSYVFSIRVTDAAGKTTEKSFTITLAQSIVISACPAPDGLTGTAYSSTVSATGGTLPYTWSISGQLAAGLALNSTSGVLSGTPLVPGSTSFALQVKDAADQSTSRACTITVTIPLTLVTQNLPDAATRTNYSQVVAVNGGSPPYLWSTTAGSLPPGFSLNENSGTITGNSTLSGRFSFTVTVTDAVGRQALRAFTINVGTGLTIPACPFPTANVGQTYSSILTAIGGQTPYAWSIVAGALPAGLTVNTNTGLISGSPTAVSTPLFTIQARDGAGATATRQCSISAAPKLVITTTSPAGASTGAPYADTVVATGGTLPYTWTISGGALPPGLTLNAATGGISGLPVQAGTFPFTVRVVDASGITVEQTLSLTVGSGFSISACPAPAATVGQSYSSGLSLSGGGSSVAWSISAGALPPGVDLVSSTGVIAGTPTQPGRSDFTVTASNGSSTSARPCSINVSPPGLAITSAAALPSGLMGSSYDQTLAAAGGRGPYTWSVATGALPSGIALSAAGKLAGAPSAAGTFQFTLRVTDQDAVSATQLFTLKVLPAAAPAITFNGLPDIVGAAQQPVVSITFDKGYPVPLKGKLVLQFTPDPTVGVDDKSISFVTGGRAVDFEVPANATQPNFPVPQLALQTGTVAGTIALAVQLSTGDSDITPPEAQKSIRIDRTAPVIVSVKVAPVTNGFEVSITGFSTTREVSSATFQFTPAAGSRLESSDVTVSTAEAARTWYRDPRSNDYGSQFTFIQPFIVRGATLSEVSVTLTNAQGTSPAVRARF